MFVTKNRVRMHDTDMAGILYFARQFRFAHDALEEFAESEGFSFDQVFHQESFVFVIVHAEADYFAPLKLGDLLEVHLTIEKIGSSSFTVNYEIYKLQGERQRVGRAQTVHVTLDSKSRTKIPIPTVLRKKLEKHMQKNSS